MYSFVIDFSQVLNGSGKMHRAKRCETDFRAGSGINMIRILEAIYESARTGKEVRL